MECIVLPSYCTHPVTLAKCLWLYIGNVIIRVKESMVMLGVPDHWVDTGLWLFGPSSDANIYFQLLV